ncbi:MAG: Ig-like domain-containing protein, partial [Chitinispirillaceae bacterium]
MRTAPVYLSASAAFLLLLSCTPDPVSPHINHPPQASNLDLETDEDKSILIDVLENCSDRDGDSLSINAFSQGENGSVVKLDSDLFYTPDSNFNGPDELTYQVRDNRGGLDTGIVRISVNPVNDPPQARNDSTEVDEDDSIVVGVLKNDHDVDNDELSIVSIGPCSYGALSLFEDSVTYTPDPDFFGSDSFKYVINDGSDLSDTAVVYVTVIPLNDNPVASDDSASTEENAVLRIPVLENDRDDDRDSLFITRIGNCVNGKISLIKDTLVYTPDSFFNGRDSFDYVVGDGRGGIDSAVVYIEIIDVNFVPVAADDSLVTDEDSVSLVDVLGNDTDFDKDSIWIKTLGSAVHGNVSLKNDSVLYAPELNFFGSDSFTYVIMDESGDSSEATVYCKIIAVNDAPVAVDDTISAKEDESVSTAVLENDTDVDGDQLSIESFTQGTNGSV